jgi:prepilin-type processing-associated H-X9-DG protein
MDDVRDGTSNTFMVGEDIPEYNVCAIAYYGNCDYGTANIPLNYMPEPPQPDNWPDVTSFRSRHPGGANFCLADGSVCFINQTIEKALYRALATKAQGEAVQVP